ncbi:MAG TPA: TonB-dependent receptor [Candidatus Dormibacteraeota bacterium]|nr:TonB-dependent receptor [Candidatus Dormibacteraeota bacterium]
MGTHRLFIMEVPALPRPLRSLFGMFSIAAAVFALSTMPVLALPTSASSLTGTLTTTAGHRPIPNVQIVIEGANGQGSFSATTDARGAFDFPSIPSGSYRLATQSTSYYARSQSIDVRNGEAASIALEGFRTIAAVVVSAPRRLAPSKSQLYHSSLTQVVLDGNIIKAQAPLAGSEQLLAAAPGVMQASYGSTGAAKGMISLRGFKQGWANQAGVVDDGLFGVTLNGVYMNNPQSGIWEPNEVPDLSIISGSRITFGPGDAASRTFDSLGGTVDFYTILPSKTSSFRSSFTTGSYGGQGYHFDFSRALSSHWGVLVAQGRTFSKGFRNILGSGNAGPGSTYGTFAELQDLFNGGSLLIFGYAADGTDYRPNLVPVTPLLGPGGSVVSVNGFDGNGNPIAGSPYSQQTSGFYSALPANVWQKTDTNATRLIGVDLTRNMGRGSYLSNQAWYRHGDRLHVKDFNFDQANNTSRFEYNNPYSNALGDNFTYHVIHGPHDISAGFNLLYSRYETRNAFYNPDPTQSAPNAPTTITTPSNFRSNDFWMQDVAFFAQDDVHLSDRAEFIPSVRTVALNTSFVNNGLAVFPACTDPASACYGNNHTSQPNSTTSFHAIEPSASFRYAVARNLAAYVSYGRGVRNPQTSPGGPYQKVSVIGLVPEATDDTEGGLKFYKRLSGTNLDGSDRENAASVGLFDSTLQNQNIPITTGQGLKVSSASGTSHYAGLTFAFSADMQRDLQIFGSYSITHASFIDYVTGGVSYNGLPVSQTPVNTGNVGMVLETPVGANLVTSRLWDQYVGPQPMWNNNLGMPDPTGLMIPSYNLVNGSLGYRFGTKVEPITVSLSATNLFNRKYNAFEYVTSGAYFAGGVGQSTNYGTGQLLAEPGPPREVQFTVSFGE